MRLPSFGGLRTRLVLLMLLALFPLGLIALWQTFRVVEETREFSRQVMLDMTAAAAVRQRELVQQAIGAGLGLGVMARFSELDTCRASMAGFLERNPGYAFAGYIPVNGLMECSSAGDLTIDFSDYETMQDAIDRADVYVEVNSDGAVSGEAVVVVSVPVFDADTLLGFVSLSIPEATVKSKAQASAVDRGFVLGAISTSGEVFDIEAPDTGAAQFMPADIDPLEMVGRAGTTFVAPDTNGQARLFSVASTAADSYVVVGSWPRATLIDDGSWVRVMTPMLFAVIMWVASMLVAYLGLNRLVLRHLRELRSAMRQFALGERTMQGLTLEDAPNEFKDAERAFNRMALLITEAEARQMTDLHDKEVLLREVHHRVKNNLQMIASIMNLQARSARTAEAREVLSGLQRRVRGLATLHRSLYTQPETSQVDAHDLVGAVVSEFSAMLPSRDLTIETDLASVMLYPDQAVPLSMWAAEALTNAVKYVGRNGTDAPYIKITLTHDGAGDVSLMIENSTGTPLVESTEDEVESSGLGTKLMTAFCRQLEGDVDVDDTNGAFVHVLRFKVQGFTAASAKSETDASVAA
ncbi:histidine kinase dimerization/phosphoacceptor domain -containing protein [uncultured Tateyamaria sp.]|uniref:sensor histidine kinase n=1 Tax=uncultured Tateyamaria sp. TaxID=455651 RepID=UPI00261C30CD|nr:histidine kinase dimerization/phosphoacceptor domain -containing protein [uncultured Tateyamaria sp.]